VNDWTTTVLLPDFQVPYHDPKMVKALIRFIGDTQPDRVVHVGDFLDAPEPSRWNKGAAGEYAGTLQASLDKATAILDELQAVFSGPKVLKKGNHDRRIEEYVKRYAPALGPLRALEFESLIEAEKYGIEVVDGLYEVAPGWIVAHGDEGSLSRSAGGTAAGLANKFGVSVACGHTHRAGLVPVATGYNGRVRSRWGLEVGHAMDVKQAGYLKGGSANWQQAFGILRVKGRTVLPELVPVVDKRFVVDGAVYEWK
jgi:UDP-2,3-diacylglucosamine pyrophosphatase LpxH